jgi:hypothetical protein
MPKLEQAELFAATTIIGASVAIWGTVPVLVAYLLWDTFFAERLIAVLCARAQAPGGATMTVNESKGLKKGTRVYWQGDAADSGIITETSWAAVTITWDNGQVASVHHGDMREIQRASTKSRSV